MEDDAQPVSCRVEQLRDAVVVRVAGDVDVRTAPHVSQVVDQALATSPGLLVVDLSEVDFLASAGLALLVSAHDRTRRGDSRLHVVAAGRATCRPIQVTGLDHLLAVYEDLAAALRDNGSRR